MYMYYIWYLADTIYLYTYKLVLTAYMHMLYRRSLGFPLVASTSN